MVEFVNEQYLTRPCHLKMSKQLYVPRIVQGVTNKLYIKSVVITTISLISLSIVTYYVYENYRQPQIEPDSDNEDNEEIKTIEM